MHKEYAISVGGSILIPEMEVRAPYIRQFTALMKNRVDHDHQRTAIVTGGGGPTRIYQQGLRELGITDPHILDTVGIRPTHDNAVLLTYALNHVGVRTQYLSTLHNPIDRSFDAWVTGGTIPGQTTDAVLVDWSQKLGIQTLINATNKSYVYDVTPEGFLNNTRPIRDLTWKEYFKLLGDRTHQPGESLPFGFTASQKAANLGLTVVILNGNNLENLRYVFEGKPFEGTTIHPEHS